MFVPTPAAPAEQWQLVDEGDASMTSAAAAGGTCQVLFRAVPEGELWSVRRIVVSCTSATPTKALLYDGTADPAKLLDGTSAGNLDVDDLVSPIQLQAGSQLLCVWSGASNGARGTANVQWSIMRRRS